MKTASRRRAAAAANGKGALTFVGTGISFAVHATPESVAHIAGADKLLYLAADSVVVDWLTGLNPTAESLYVFYAPGKPRTRTYAEIVSYVLEWVNRPCRVTVAVYGHPGVFVLPAHEAIRQARKQGVPAQMLPGISADACLFADLGIDPGAAGCQSYEATDFLLRPRRFDPHTPLILWQIGFVAEQSIDPEPNRAALAELVRLLEPLYGSDHRAALYVASSLRPLQAKPTVVPVTLSELPSAVFPPIATLFVPPAGLPKADSAMLERLGLRNTIFDVPDG